MSEKFIKRLITFLCFFVLFLIALGGSVRAMDAGLACPDWPLCFGQFVPDFHPQVYFEFIHRVVAGFVAIATAVLTFGVFKRKEYPPSARVLVSLMCLVLIVQIVMGGLTVLKLLYFPVVTAHLFLGILFFVLLLTLHFKITRAFPVRDQSTPKFIHFVTFGSVLVVFGQIILGGLVSSNYAGLACPDFPLCNGAWIPPLEGNVAIQVIHRFGAYATFAFLYLMYFVVRSQLGKSWMKRSMLVNSRFALGFVMIQVIVGMSNVIFKIPPVITVVHLAVAAMILFFCLKLALLGYYEAERS